MIAGQDISMNKPELLSPAGGYETMVGAFNAGADAVYLGGTKFGARAYADNFDRDEVLDAIVYAHLHGKKIYLTVNTLVKEKEYSELYDFMLPYAEKHLDGVIVQDFGVMRLIGREFPGIELHASTQQTVTGVYYAKLLKELGCSRVVPARELSLNEMRAIRQEADIEVEAFIHGAMCYCYSGACLFSSVVGGRSGNRGRCAQPCRLPYRVKDFGNKELYPLSLKDMNTIEMIPDLIDAGIDSFKIEGRMKKPEYSAGVTALYRKYIDKFLNDPNGEYSVSKEDMEILKALYQRTGISSGYYKKHNGREMVTVTSPAYNSTSDEILKSVHEKYLKGPMKLDCSLECRLTTGESASLSMKALTGENTITCEVHGNPVQAASKRPMEPDAVKKQITKLGNTPFEAKKAKVIINDKGTGDGIFISVGELNDLRRRLCDEMTERLLNTVNDAPYEKKGLDTNLDIYKKDAQKTGGKYGTESLWILVNQKEQLEAVYEKGETVGLPGMIIMDSDLLFKEDGELFLLVRKFKDKGTKAVAALPFITRRENEILDGIREVSQILEKLDENGLDGVLIRSIEQLSFLRNLDYSGDVYTDYGIYFWNSEAVLEILGCNNGDGKSFFINEISVPYELNYREVKDLADGLKNKVDIPMAYNIYGHIPMMISAGCVKNTLDKCSGQRGRIYSENFKMTDRMNNDLPVTIKCRDCMNIIWNAHPTSLHKKLSEIMGDHRFDHLRMDFTVEDRKKTGTVYEYFAGLIKGIDTPDIFEKASYTAGHFSRGAE